MSEVESVVLERRYGLVSMTQTNPNKQKKITRQYHFAFGGVLYVAVTTLLMLGALNSQNNLLFAAMGVSIGGLVVSGILSGWALLGVRVERISVSDASVGRPMTIRYRVHNKNRFVPAFALVIEERLHKKSSWNDSFAVPRACIAHLGPGKSVECEAQVWPTRRGQVLLEDIRVWSTFPIGIAKKSITEHASPDGVIIRPLVVAIRDALLRKADGASRSGRQMSRRAGQGDEFFSLREYQPGDPIRQIAWRATARTGQTLVTQQASPVPDRLRLVLELSVDSESTGANERAISFAASIISRASKSATMVGLSVPQVGLALQPGSGRRNVDRLLDELGRLDLTSPFVHPRTITPPVAGPRDSVIVVYADSTVPEIDLPQARHIRADSAADWIAGADALGSFQSLVPKPQARSDAKAIWERFSRWASMWMTGKEERIA